MSGLSYGDYLRQKMSAAQCCNPPVHRTGPRDASETTAIIRLRTVGNGYTSATSAPLPQGCCATIGYNTPSTRAKLDASTKAEAGAGCVVAYTTPCTTTQTDLPTTYPAGACRDC